MVGRRWPFLIWQRSGMRDRKVQRLDHMAQIGPRIIDVCTVADPVESERAGGGGRRAAREFAVLELSKGPICKITFRLL